MLRIKKLVQKELIDIFSAPMIYILAALFSFIMGWLFFNYLVSSKELSSVNIKDSVIVPIFGNMNFIFIFLSPLLTMRVFAEEKKQYTLDLLLISKLSETEIIIGKFISVFFSALFLLAMTIVFPIVISFSGFNDWGLIAASYMGVIFSIMCYIAVGIFCSALTDNQIISAVVTFCLLLGSMLLVASVNATNNFILAQMIQYMAVPYHYEAFTNGVLKSFSFVYYTSFLFFSYLVTLKTLQSRKW